MDTVYVLMEEGWEYNDEIFFQGESGGGRPRSFFLSEEEANKARDEKNVEKLKELFDSGEIRQYCYGFDELIPYNHRKDREKRNELDDLCERIFGKDFNEVGEELEDNDEIKAKDEATDADWLGLMSHIKLSFWDVVMVERE